MKFTLKAHRYYYENILYQFQRKRILLFTFSSFKRIESLIL